MMKLPLAQQPPADMDMDDDPDLKAMEEKLKKKMQEIKESENPNLFTFDDGDTVDFSLPPDTSFAEGVEPDADGYRPITWTQLKKKFCYERPAHGFKLCGDISQKLQEHWERSKQIKIRDCDGVEGAVFFYCEEDKPYFDWQDIMVGNNITVKSPRYHRFMDKQEGMRLEDNKQMCPIEKQRFGDNSRLDYGVLNKNHGNKKFAEGKYEDAMEFYDTAIKHMRGSFKESPDDEPKAKELVAQCFLNIAQCHMSNKNYQYVEAPCQSALGINANQACNAKAYFRMGSAALLRKELNHAKVNLERALQLAPNDPKIIECVNSLNSQLGEQKTAEKKLYKTETGKFGPRKWILSDMPDKLSDTPNFRDICKVVGKSPFSKEGPDAGQVLKKNHLYRCGSVGLVSKRDLTVITESFGIKTILDLRSGAEKKMSDGHCQTLLKKEAKLLADGVTKEDDPDTKEMGEDGEKKKRDIIFHADTAKVFLPINVSCTSKNGEIEGPPKIELPKVPEGHGDVLEGRVAYQIDLSSRAVFHLIPKWVWIVVYGTAIIGLWFSKWYLWVASLVTKHSAVKVKQVGMYHTILAKCKPEVREIFRILANERNYPVVITCSMGKDRTGIITGLALASIGVPDALVAADFAETTKSIREMDKKAQRAIGLPPSWDVAPQEHMLDLLREVRETYGSVNSYLTRNCGVSQEEIEGLKRCLLKAPPAPAPAPEPTKKEDEGAAPTAGGDSKVEEIKDDE